MMIYLYPLYGFKGLFGFFILAFPPYALMALAIISGFLITYSSLNLIHKNNSRLPIKEFLFKRFIRLYPALLFSVCLMIISFLIISHFCITCIYHYTPPGAKFSLLQSLSIVPKNYLASLAFLQGIFIGPDAPTMNLPLWTLSYEFWYYILFMFITLIFVNKRYIIGSGLLTLLLAYMLVFHQFHFLFLSIVWLSGVILALSYASNRLFSNEYKPIFFLLLTALIMICIASLVTFGHYILIPISNHSFFVQTCFALILTLLLSMFLHLNIPLKKRFFKRLAGCANFSYTLYMMHYPLLLLSFHFTWGYIQHWPTLAIVFVMLIYSLIIIYFCKKCAIVLENKTLYRNVLSRIFNQKVIISNINAESSEEPLTEKPS